ncbi:MAG: hypothetical protein LBT56_03165 [Prevotellaceae bacterium]|jgi:hypothetical protein|nr:hypothetical protein [Prevotellaceae bacterium]
MKNIIKIMILSVFAATLFVSCNEEDNYGTDFSVQILAGEWAVTTPESLVDSIGETWRLRTSNTVDNSKNALLLTDAKSFWKFIVTVPFDLSNTSFGQNDTVVNQYYDVHDESPVIEPYDIGVIVKNGKVTPQAITLPSGWKADKISFTIAFGNDNYTEYNIAGYRISGFLEDAGYVYRE